MTTIRATVSGAGFTVVAAFAVMMTASGTGRSAGTPEQMPKHPQTPKAGRPGLSAPVPAGPMAPPVPSPP